MKKAAATQWYQTRRMYTVWAVAALVVAYAFASWAINSGSLLQYFLSIVLVILAVRFAVHAFRNR